MLQAAGNRPIPTGYGATFARSVGLFFLLMLQACFIFRQPVGPPKGPDLDSASDIAAEDGNTVDTPLDPFEDGPTDADTVLDADSLSSDTDASLDSSDLAQVGDCLSGGSCPPAAPICGPQGCQVGIEGQPCGTNADCSVVLAPYCAPDDLCHNGSDGDPCSGTEQCALELDCSAGFCAPACSDTCNTCSAGCCRESCGGSDSTCDLLCGSGCACEFDCRAANNCEILCAAADSCEVDCALANNCAKIRCTENAACLVDCSGANNCEFDQCTGGTGVRSCSGDVIVCNRACP